MINIRESDSAAVCRRCLPPSSIHRSSQRGHERFPPPEPPPTLPFLRPRSKPSCFGDLARVDLARAPEARGAEGHGLAPVAEDACGAGGDSERSEDADVEATAKH